MYWVYYIGRRKKKQGGCHMVDMMFEEMQIGVCLSLFPKQIFRLSVSYPDGAPLFWKRGGKAPGAPAPGPRIIITPARTRSFCFRTVSFPLLSLNTGRVSDAITKGRYTLDFVGVVPVETVNVRFYRTTCPGQGISIFPYNSCRRRLSQHTESCFIPLVKLAIVPGSRARRPWRFPSAFQKADSRPEGYGPR